MITFNSDVYFGQTGDGNLYLAQNLKYLREQKGMNQNEIADILKISKSAVGHWEQKHRYRNDCSTSRVF